jgi:hypothetical protein
MQLVGDLLIGREMAVADERAVFGFLHCVIPPLRQSVLLKLA